MYDIVFSLTVGGILLQIITMMDDLGIERKGKGIVFICINLLMNFFHLLISLLVWYGLQIRKIFHLRMFVIIIGGKDENIVSL